MAAETIFRRDCARKTEHCGLGVEDCVNAAGAGNFLVEDVDGFEFEASFEVEGCWVSLRVMG